MKSLKDLEKDVQEQFARLAGGNVPDGAQALGSTEAAVHAALGHMHTGKEAMAAIEKSQREILAGYDLGGAIRTERESMEAALNPKAWAEAAGLHAAVSGSVTANDLLGMYDSTLKSLDATAHFATADAAVEAIRTASVQEEEYSRGLRLPTSDMPFEPPPPMDFTPKALPADPEMLQLHAKQLQVLQKLAAGIEAADEAGQESLRITRRNLWVGVATLCVAVLSIGVTIWAVLK